MAIFFGQRPGAVVRLDDSAVQCKITLLAGVDPTIGFVGERSIVTRVVLSQNVNAQFLHTLGHYVYIYVFGDRVGELQLSGFAFPCDCNGPVHGGERLHHWYRRHKASRRRQPARFVLGDTLLEGFIMGMRLDVVDTAINLMQWQANVVLLPEDDLVDPDAADNVEDNNDFQPDELPDYATVPQEIEIGEASDEINLEGEPGPGAAGNQNQSQTQGVGQDQSQTQGVGQDTGPGTVLPTTGITRTTRINPDGSVTNLIIIAPPPPPATPLYPSIPPAPL